MALQMSTQTLSDAATLLADANLVDQVQVLDVGEPVTVGASVARALSAVGTPVPALVQTTTLANAAESLSEALYSVKVALGTGLFAGQAVRVVSCVRDSTLVGQVLLIDKVSANGNIRKGIASKTTVVNQEGKEGIA